MGDDTFCREDLALVEAVSRQVFDGAKRLNAWMALTQVEANAIRMRAAAIIRTVRRYEAERQSPAVVLLPHLGRVA